MSSEWDHIERHDQALSRIAKRLVKINERLYDMEKSLEFQQRNLWDHELYSVNENLSLEDKIDLLVKVTRKNQDRLEFMEDRWVEMINDKADQVLAKGGEKE